MGNQLTFSMLPLPQAQDLNVIEEVIRMMLEIINSCLCNSLHHNPNLVYALLYKRELFEQFRMHPSFQDIMQNIDTVSHLKYPRQEKDRLNFIVPFFLVIGWNDCIDYGCIDFPSMSSVSAGCKAQKAWMD